MVRRGAVVLTPTCGTNNSIQCVHAVHVLRSKQPGGPATRLTIHDLEKRKVAARPVSVILYTFASTSEAQP